MMLMALSEYTSDSKLKVFYVYDASSFQGSHAALFFAGLLTLLMGWRSDDVFIDRLLWLSGANDLPTDQHILEPPTIAWSQVRWSGDIQDPRLNESSGLAASNYPTKLIVVDQRQR